MPGFSVFVTAVAGLAAWSARRLGPMPVLWAGSAGVALVVLGLAAIVGWFVPVGLLVASIAVGVLVGRLVPARAGPMAWLLGVLSVADIAWIASGGGSPSGFVAEVANLSVSFGSATSSIGTVDVVLAAAVASHWAARGAPGWLAVVGAPLGMVLANVFVAVTGVGNLPLVPFIAAGWAATEAWGRIRGLPVTGAGAP